MDIAVLIAVLIGGLPPLVWLWFWFHEDSNAEPKLAVFSIFLLGGISVYAAIFFETIVGIVFTGTLMIIGYAVVEEVIKSAVGVLPALRKGLIDESIDYPIYMITAALGFAFVENILFLSNDASLKNAELLLVTGNLRFLGATVLHGAAAGIIGIALAYRHQTKSFVLKILFLVCGLLMAIILHSAFNLLILTGTESYSFIVVFGSLWIVTMVILFLMERVRILPHHNKVKKV